MNIIGIENHYTFKAPLRINSIRNVQLFSTKSKWFINKFSSFCIVEQTAIINRHHCTFVHNNAKFLESCIGSRLPHFCKHRFSFCLFRMYSERITRCLCRKCRNYEK